MNAYFQARPFNKITLLLIPYYNLLITTEAVVDIELNSHLTSRERAFERWKSKVV